MDSTELSKSNDMDTMRASMLYSEMQHIEDRLSARIDRNEDHIDRQLVKLEEEVNKIQRQAVAIESSIRAYIRISMIVFPFALTLISTTFAFLYKIQSDLALKISEPHQIVLQDYNSTKPETKNNPKQE